MRNVFGRLGMVGAILLVSALIFGALAGGVVVHRLQSTSVASSEQDRGDESGGDDHSKTKQRHPNNSHHDNQEPDEPEDKDA